MLRPESLYISKYVHATLQVQWPYAETGFDTAANEGHKHNSASSGRDNMQGKPISHILLHNTFTEFH